MTMTDKPERARRVADLWDRHPEMPEADVFAQVDADLAREAEERAENEAATKELTDSLAGFWSCGVCGEIAGPARDGLCDKCRTVVAPLVAERNAAELVRGRSRRELAEAYLERRGA
jgi:hypothetical protein